MDSKESDGEKEDEGNSARNRRPPFAGFKVTLYTRRNNNISSLYWPQLTIGIKIISGSLGGI